MLNKMSILCHVTIQWEHFLRGVLGTTLLLPLVLVDAQLGCTTRFSLPEAEPDVEGKEMGGLFQGSDYTQCKGINLLWEPQPEPGPTHHVKQQGKQMCDCLWMRCQGVRCMCSLFYSCVRTQLWPVWHLCGAQQMPVQRRLARETLQ